MAVQAENIVKQSDVAKLFNDVIVETILKDAYHSGNIPMDEQYQCIPTDILGNIDSVERAGDIGPAETTISASSLYNELVRLTTALTRVGTFTWVRTYNTNGNIEIQNEMSGKALFNTSYIRSLAAVNSDHGIVAESIVRVFNINTLLSNLLAAWENTERYEHNERLDLCHSVCHVVCYSDCYCNSSCYK